MPQTIPNGPDDTATFETSTEPDVLVDKPTELNAVVFRPGAQPFLLQVEGDNFEGQVLTLSGVGVTNESGVEQTLEPCTLPGPFEVGGLLQFTQHACR